MFRFAGRLGGALFVLGLAIGATLFAPMSAGGATTRSQSCAGLSFYPADNVTEYANDGALRYLSASTASGTGTFRCDPGLPTGAIVTKVQFTLLDKLNTYQVFGCELRRSGLQLRGTAPIIQTMAGPLNSGGLYNAGGIRLSTTAISYATVDNSAFGYWLECTIEFSPVTPNNYEGIYGADVIYTITAAKG